MSTEPALLPGALEEPTVPVRRGFITAVVLANLGIMMAFYTPIQNLLPRLAQDVAPDSKEAALAWITAAGAFASIVFNPLAGALSDRTTARWGRRKPWVLLGAVAGGVAIVALGIPGTVLGLAVIWFLAQMAINASYAGLTATVPDQVPVRQRGLVSGWIGLAQTAGIVLGVAIVSFVVTDLRTGLVITAVLLVVLVLPFTLGARDIPLGREHQPPFSLGLWLRGFWISPRLYPDFAWAWLTRFLMMLGNAMATLYLLFWLQDEVGYAEPEQGQTVLIALYALGTILTAVVFGAMSDRSGRRKVYVIAATCVMAVAMAMLAFFPVFPAAMLAALILGLGYGMYLGVDQALVTQV
ncbi:MAG TPA: MFS transporter, partial [Candidatus Limnocylindrales bacterium]|nr:MFS transporter [Candidatus Limnocylindrales bacterium]